MTSKQAGWALAITLVLALCLESAFAAVTPCKGTTKKGTPCKSTFVGKSGFCRAHDPATPRCGKPTSSGAPCKVAGTTCRFHK